MTKMTTLLQRSAWLAWLLIIASFGGAAYLMTDTQPPVFVESYTVNSPRAGEVLYVDAAVHREVGRRCSLEFSRHIIDSSGTPMEVVGTTFRTAEAIARLDESSPNRLKLAVPVPAYAKPGKAKVVTPLAHSCNPWHAIRPIESTMVMEFVIRP